MKKLFLMGTILCLLLAVFVGCSYEHYEDSSNEGLLSGYSGETISSGYMPDYAMSDAGISEQSMLPCCENSGACFPHGFGGHFRECQIHSEHFHAFDIFIYRDGVLNNQGVITSADFHLWAGPLREERLSPYSECLVNLVTFFEYFGVSRETVERIIDYTRVDFIFHYNLDVLFSGDRSLIDLYYCITNEHLHAELANEREIAFWTEGILNLQKIVIANSRMSRYYHDIWTYAGITPAAGKAAIYSWMRELVDARRYESVNIVELLNHFDMPRDAFERLMIEYNLFTHYNLDVIFSGDQYLIESYYSIENEAAHTAQIQEAILLNERSEE